MITPAALSPASRPTPLEGRTPHGAAAAAAKSDLVGGKAGEIRTETLPNGVRLVIAERPGARKVKIQIGAGAGAMQDPNGKLGLAHLLEHLAFEGSPTRPGSVQQKARTELGGAWNAYTNRSRVVYYGIVPSKDAKTGASLITDMYQNPTTTGPRVKQEKAAVTNEMLYAEPGSAGSLSGELWHIGERLLNGEQVHNNNVIGTRKSVAAITPKDLQNYHRQYYTGRNTVALIEGDSKSLPVDVLRKQLGALEPGGRVDHDGLDQSFRKGIQVQAVPDNSSGSVSLNVMVPIPAAETAGKKDPLADAATKLFEISLSNVLHDRLRRNNHLTYGASATISDNNPEDGSRYFEVKTTVAKGKEQEAVADIVDILRDSQDGFGPKTFATHRKEWLSALSMREPKPAPTAGADISARAEATFQAALEDAGISVPPAASADTTRKTANALASKLEKLTYKQFQGYGKQLVDLDNLKVLAYGPVGDGKQLVAGLKAADIKPSKVELNPIDLSMYTDMGVGPQK